MNVDRQQSNCRAMFTISSSYRHIYTSYITNQSFAALWDIQQQKFISQTLGRTHTRRIKTCVRRASS